MKPIATKFVFNKPNGAHSKPNSQGAPVQIPYRGNRNVGQKFWMRGKEGPHMPPREFKTLGIANSEQDARLGALTMLESHRPKEAVPQKRTKHVMSELLFQMKTP